MFGKKKTTSQIDKEQLELIENAQKRIKQKKRLYVHFVIFLIGSLVLILANLTLGIGKDVTLFGVDWFVYVVLLWLILLLYHTFNVFITHKFMGKAWEQQQLDTLVSKQRDRIDKLKQQLLEKEAQIAKNEVEDELTKKKRIDPPM